LKEACAPVFADAVGCVSNVHTGISVGGGIADTTKVDEFRVMFPVDSENMKFPVVLGVYVNVRFWMTDKFYVFAHY
jgi:hypothetical protein